MTLKEQMQDDLDIFVNIDEFGVDCVFSVGGVDKDVNVLFDLIQDDQEEGLIPLARGKKTDFDGIVYGATLIIEGVTYGVLNWYDEGGLLSIVMNEAD